MPDIEQVRTYLDGENGLAVISTTQADGRVLSSIANCGVIDHPTTGMLTVAMVSTGGAARLGHIRRGSEVTVAIRRGWNWISVTGPADIVGPDEAHIHDETDGLRLLLREVFQSAGGTHDNYDEFDRAMSEDRRAAILVNPTRILGNN